jgi:hypothetical protein
MPAQPRNRLRDRDAFLEAMRVAIESHPEAVTQEGMADLLGMSTRTLSRRLKELQIDWPPFDNWSELVKNAALMGSYRRGTAVQSIPDSSWLITYQIQNRRLVAASTPEEAIAKLRAEIKGEVRVVSVQQA